VKTVTECPKFVKILRYTHVPFPWVLYFHGRLRRERESESESERASERERERERVIE
jgi:hypothetical protein